MKVWQCTVCKYIHKGDAPPEKCPVCGVDSSKFIEIDEASIPGETPKKTENLKEKKSEKKTPTPAPKASSIKSIYEQINAALLKHHAHPVSVHTPNGVLPIAVILFILAWFLDSQLFVKAAVINLVFVFLALPLVIYTGILEWKNKYNRALTTIFKIKITAAAITCASCIIALAWYLFNPQILNSSVAWVFIGINIVMLAAAGIAGFIGGKLVFKD